MTTAEKNGDSARAVPETELASVVLHAGEMSDVTYLKDYIQVVVVFNYLLVTQQRLSGQNQHRAWANIQVILHTLNCPPVVIGRYSAAY